MDLNAVVLKKAETSPPLTRLGNLQLLQPEFRCRQETGLQRLDVAHPRPVLLAKEFPALVAFPAAFFRFERGSAACP